MYLEDIQFSLNEILDYTDEMAFETFTKDRRTRYSILMHFTIIGEAANKIPKTVQIKYPEVPWKKMYALRNVVSHGYFDVRNEQLWEIIKNDIPDNKKQIEHILQIERKS